MGQRIVVLDTHGINDNRINKHIASVRSSYPVYRININLSQKNEVLKDEGMVIHYFPTNNPYLNGALFTLGTSMGIWSGRLVSALRRDFVGDKDELIIHVHDPYLLGLAAGISRRIPNTKTVYDRHEYYESWKNRLGFSVPGMFELWFGKRVSELIFVSRRTDSLPRIFQGLPISVIPNYPISENFPRNAVDNKIIKFDDNEIVAAYFGVLNLNFDRDIKLMMMVMDQVMQKDARVRFVIAGKVYDDEIFKSIEEMSFRFGERMSYLGELPYDEVVERTRSSHLGLFLLRSDSPMWREDQPVSPNKIYEYLLSGTIPVVKAILDDEETIADCGLTFDSSADCQVIANAILHLISDRNKMRALMLKSREVGEDFTWENVAERYLECYRRLFSSVSDSVMGRNE